MGQWAAMPGHAPTAPLPGAFGIGSVVGSLNDMSTLFARCGSLRCNSFNAWKNAGLPVERTRRPRIHVKMQVEGSLEQASAIRFPA